MAAKAATSPKTTARIVRTLDEVGEALGRTAKTIQNWRKHGVAYPFKGPYDIDSIRDQAFSLGLYTRLGSDPLGIAAGAVKPGVSKLVGSMPEVAAMHAVEKFKLTKAKRENEERAGQRQENQLVPLEPMNQFAMELAAELRHLALRLQQDGLAEAAQMVTDTAQRVASRARQRIAALKHEK